MASLGSIQFACEDTEFKAGAAFLLGQPCKIKEQVSFEAFSEIEVDVGNPYVVAHIKDASSSSEAFSISHEAAQKGLDLLSIEGKANLSIRNAVDECLIWWRSDSKRILRAVSTVPFGIAFSSAMLVVYDSDGNEKPDPEPPAPIYHPSLRYFRVSQVTDDLFDSYRNMWLSFESLLSYKYPKANTEGERGWLIRALGNVNNEFDLSNAYKPTGEDIVSEIIEELYQDARLPLFHSKEDLFLPQALPDRDTVSEALPKLARLVLLLVRNWLNIRRIDGGFTYVGFDVATKPILENSFILVSDDNSPFNGGETLSHPAYDNAVKMTTRYAPELSKPGLNVALGTVTTDKLEQLSKIARFGLIFNNEVGLVEIIETGLAYEGIDQLEAQMAIRLRNIQRPKLLFHG